MLLFPQFDPVAVQLGPIAIRWYGLAYVAALLIGLYYAKVITRAHPARNLTPLSVENFFTWMVLGVVLGGRLGYVLFYNPMFFLSHPVEILKVWEGGMSFHGGLIGVITALFLYSRHIGAHPIDLADRIVPAVPIGLFLGRIANFINGELVGRIAPADLPWSMIFPQIDLHPRHPSQLYEAGLEGLVLFAILFFIILRPTMRRWLPSGIFLTGYALARLVVENFRTPEITHQLGPIILTQGQVLTLPMLVVGLVFLYLAARGKPSNPA